MKTMTWVEFLEEGERNTEGCVCEKCGELLPDNLVNLYSGLCNKHIEEEMDSGEWWAVDKLCQ